MSTGIIIFIIIFTIIAFVGTLVVMKNENDKVKEYEEKGETAKEELKRSHEYESKSLQSNIPILTAIYVVVIVGSLIALFFYIFSN